MCVYYNCERLVFYKRWVVHVDEQVHAEEQSFSQGTEGEEKFLKKNFFSDINNIHVIKK